MKAPSTHHHRRRLREACREEERAGSVRAAALSLKMERCWGDQPPHSPQSPYLRWEERLDLRPSPGGSGEAGSQESPAPQGPLLRQHGLSGQPPRKQERAWKGIGWEEHPRCD